MIEDIKHPGVVKSIEGNRIIVEIISKSMCSACHAKSMCTMGDMKVKEVEVWKGSKDEYVVGEEVNLKIKRSLGLRAVWISYVIPLFILLVFLLSLSNLCGSELATGGVSVGAVAIYYLLVYLFRKKIAREFVFTIEKK